MKRIITLAILGFLSMFLVLPVFGGGQPQEAEKTRVVLTIWGLETEKYHTDSIEAVIQANPDIFLDVVELPHAYEEYQLKLNAMLAGNERADVITCFSFAQYTDLVSGGIALPLDDLIESDKELDMSNFGPVVDNMRVDGIAYALPYRNDGWLLYYNKGIFNDAGIAYPNNDYTWQEYREDAKKLTNNKSGDQKIWGSYWHWWPITHALPSLQYAYQKDGWNTMTGSSFEYRPGFELVLQMQDVDKSIMDYASLRAQSTNWNTLFYHGQTAMFFTGTWALGFYVKDKGEQFDFDWGAAQLPTWGGGMRDGCVAAPTPIIINSKSPEVEASWKILSSMCGPVGAKELVESCLIPGYIDPEILTVISENPKLDPSVKDALIFDRMYPEYAAHPKSGAFGLAYQETIEVIRTHVKSIDEALGDLNKYRKELLNE